MPRTSTSTSTGTSGTTSTSSTGSTSTVRSRSRTTSSRTGTMVRLSDGTVVPRRRGRLPRGAVVLTDSTTSTSTSTLSR